MLQEVNQNLKLIVSYYQGVSQFTCEKYNHTYQSVNDLTTKFGSQLNLSKKNAIRIKEQFQNQIISLVEQASNELLIRTENLLLPEEQRPSEKEKKQLKKRFKRVFNKIINDYVIFYSEQAKQYNMALVNQGRQYFQRYVMPLYIKMKAAVLVSKEILIQMLESRFDDMKVTYTVSKDTVTMMIRGKFQEDKIIQKINYGMQNFKEFTVKVVKKGLQIKVDKKSLYDNYQTFSLKLMEVIRQMRQKGAQRIVSAKQKTAELYQSVLNRIRQKQILLKMEYKELKDRTQKKPNQCQSSL